MNNGCILRRPGASFVYVCKKFRHAYDSAVSSMESSKPMAAWTGTEARVASFVYGRATLVHKRSDEEFPRPFPWAPSSWLLWPIVCPCGRISDLSRLSGNAFICDQCFQCTIGDTELIRCLMNVVSYNVMYHDVHSRTLRDRYLLSKKRYLRCDIWTCLSDIDVHAMELMLSIDNKTLAEVFVDEGVLTRLVF